MQEDKQSKFGGKAMRKKILVVEDSWTVQRLASLGLNYAGYQVLKSENGKQALEVLKEHTPDLILLDVIMPEMDGFEFLEIIKKDEAKKHIPVVMLTTEGQEENRKKGLSMGAWHYMVKPFDTQDLIDCVDKVLKEAA
jgi:DNA-binding response OmpR family regulator